MTGSEVQNQTEYSKEQDKSTNTEKKINGIVIEGRDPKTADKINKTMYAKFIEIMESTPRGKKLIQDCEFQMNKITGEEKHPQSSEKDNNKKEVDNIIGEANYLNLSNINEIKVHLFGVDPAQVYLAVNNEKYTDSERIKQVIKALKEPGITINGSGSKSIQDLQILMGKTLGIRLNPDGKFGKDTFGAMKKYLLGETVTAKNANEANNTRVNASDVMFGNEKLPIQNEDGKNFVEIDGKKYYEYENGMNGLGYQNGINKNGIEYTYIGNYVNGYWEGNGTITRANGAKYEGEWENGKKEGFGTFIYDNGAKYEGDWKNDKFEGEGTYIYANGDKYEGDWKNDKCEGKGTATRANGDKYEGDWKNDKCEGFGTYICENGDKYEGAWKEGHAEGSGTRTWANGKSVEGIFAKEDSTMFGLKTPTKFIDNSGEYKVVRDNELLKVVSEGKYEGKYISVETGEFVDTPSTNHDSDQDNDQADNPKDNNVDNQSAEKKTSSYTDLLNELKDIGNKEIVYKPNENTTFNFTEKGCRLETSGKVINFKKRGSGLGYYTADIGDRKGDAYMYMRDKFIYIYRVSLRPIKKLYYPSGAEFEGKCDERGILEEGIMTNSDGTTFEGSFTYNEKTQTVKQGEPHKVNIENLGRFWD